MVHAKGQTGRPNDASVADTQNTYVYRRCQNYRTKLGMQKYGKIPYLSVPSYSSGSRFRADSDPVL